MKNEKAFYKILISKSGIENKSIPITENSQNSYKVHIEDSK